MIKIFLTYLLLITGSFAFSGGKKPVKHDSIVQLRFDHIVVYKKNKVGVYNTKTNAYLIKMTPGQCMIYQGVGEFDGVEVLVGNQLQSCFIEKDTAIVGAQTWKNSENSLLIPSYKNAYFLVDTVSKNIILRYYDPVKKGVFSERSNTFLHMSVTYEVAQKNQQYGTNGTERCNTFYAIDSCFKKASGSYLPFQFDPTEMYYNGDLKLTPFNKEKCEYFGVSFSGKHLIVYDYNPFPQKINEVQYQNWAQSAIYQIDQKKWIKPTACVNIIPIINGGYIYSTSANSFNHFTLDKNGENKALLEVYLNESTNQINPNIILGGNWDKTEHMALNTNKINYTNYYLCAEKEQVTVFQMQAYRNFIPHYPEVNPSDFVTISPTHSLVVSLKDDSLYLNFQSNYDVVVYVDTMNFDLFFPYFSSVNEEYPYFDLSKQPPPENYSDLRKEPFLQITKTEDALIINIPFVLNRNIPKTNFLDNTVSTEITFFETQESAVFINSGSGYFPVKLYYSNVTPYSFGYLLRTGIYLSKVDGESNSIKHNSEYPHANKKPVFELVNKNGETIMAYKQKSFSQVLDLGFGLQVYINGKSFFMNYDGEIITQPIYHEFEIVNGELLGTIYNDVSAKDKSIFRRDAFQQF